MKPNTMADVAYAFGVLWRLLQLNGRRKQRIELGLRMRRVPIDPFSNARTAPMMTRAERRARVHELRKEAKQKHPEATKRDLREGFVFRPVCGYVGPAFLPRGEK